MMNLSQNPQQQIWEKMQRSCIFVASSFVTNICFLTNFTELEITKIQENYWWGQMHCGHPAKILGGPRPTRPTLQRRHAALLCIVSSRVRLSSGAVMTDDVTKLPSGV